MKQLIFDFDGTIVNSKAVYYYAINKHLNPLGFNRKEVDKAIDIGLNIGETLKKFGLSSFTKFFLKRKIMKDVLDKTNKVKKCKDIESIRKIKARKILVSNSLLEFVLPVLKHLKLNCFDEIYGADNFDNKEEFIKRYLRENKIDKKQVYYVGDRVADIKLARKVGIKSIIILGKCAWDSRKEILVSKPDFVVESLDDVAKLV